MVRPCIENIFGILIGINPGLFNLIFHIKLLMITPRFTCLSIKICAINIFYIQYDTCMIQLSALHMRNKKIFSLNNRP